MTELEKHLSEALQSLSAQYEQEQKSAAARISGLSGQVTTLRERVSELLPSFPPRGPSRSGPSR